MLVPSGTSITKSPAFFPDCRFFEASPPFSALKILFEYM